MKRRFVIGTVDGAWHYSDWLEDSVLQAHLDENDGLIGQDPSNSRDVYVDSPEEALEFMSNFLKLNDSLNTQVFNMELNGITRRFNVRHIMWWQVESVDKDAWDV